VNKNRIISFILLLPIFLTGCWGQIEIENRGFIIGSAIDLGEQDQQSEDIQLKMTNQVVNPPLFGTPGGGGGGPSQGAATKNFTETGRSMLEMTADLAAEIQRSPFYEHMKVLVVSEDAAGEEPGFFPGLMDFFIRESEMRRSMKVVIAEGEAKQLLEVNPEGERLPMMYIDTIFQNANQTLNVLDPTLIGDLQEYLLRDFSYLIPMIKAEEQNKAQVTKAAVFQGNTDVMVGKLTENEVRGFNLIKGNKQGGVIDFHIDDELMVVEASRIQSSMATDPSDLENINISIQIKVEGFIEEMFNSDSLLNSKYLEEIEKKAEERVEELATAVIKKGQDELKVDFFDFNEVLHGKHYRKWQQIKDDWERGDQLFSNNTTIDVNAEVNVRGIGATDKSKRVND